MAKGNIGITTENIFPVIKKFLYSDHEIFLRELVSNAVDATQKLKTYASKGDFKGELGDLTIQILLDEQAGTITISDRGIGMTAEEVEKYINQIAFSGANDFLEKYKNDANAIIGHFGLGFYSSFMVAKQVEIFTRSYREGSQAVRWVCDGSPAYEMNEVEKAERGTDIVLHIDEEAKEFLATAKLQELLKKYCRFLPVPIAFGKKKEWKEGKEVETDEPNIINVVDPLWTKAPSSLQKEDYQTFYRDLYPMSDEPLFWIHLNVDYPFNLTGVLYFPQIKNNLDVHRDRIQLYSNQVYVTDHVENIVPEFLTLLHGVIDSPDIPLNVSRSYLQSDANVKKISSYIEKKVADRLLQIFKDDRKDFEEKWEGLKLFIHYGMLSQPDFYDRAAKMALFKDVDGKFFTYEEYRELIKDNQTDKDGNLIYLYTSNAEQQYSFVRAAKDKGYSVLSFDGQLDTALVGLLEQKNEKARFVRVDGDTIDRLIVKEEAEKSEISDTDAAHLSTLFSTRLPKIEKVNFHVESRPLGSSAAPVVITQSEYMRRMKEMSQFQGGMNFYGEMPDMFTLVLNTNHALIARVLQEMQGAIGNELSAHEKTIKELEARQAAMQQVQGDKKADELSEDEKKEQETCRNELQAARDQQQSSIATYADNQAVVSQLIDLALIQNGLLKGEALDLFCKRSIDMIAEA